MDTSYTDRDARGDRQWWLCNNLKRAALCLATRAWLRYERSGDPADRARACYHTKRARHHAWLSEQGYNTQARVREGAQLRAQLATAGIEDN